MIISYFYLSWHEGSQLVRSMQHQDQLFIFLMFSMGTNGAKMK